MGDCQNYILICKNWGVKYSLFDYIHLSQTECKFSVFNFEGAYSDTLDTYILYPFGKFYTEHNWEHCWWIFLLTPICRLLGLLVWIYGWRLSKPILSVPIYWHSYSMCFLRCILVVIQIWLVSCNYQISTFLIQLDSLVKILRNFWDPPLITEVISSTFFSSGDLCWIDIWHKFYHHCYAH